jgi:hypothetical protein
LINQSGWIIIVFNISDLLFYSFYAFKNAF